MNTLSKVFKSKIVVFLLQFFILSLLIYLFAHEFHIDFDKNITRERADIIQFLANYVMFDGSVGLIFIYSSWLFVSTISIFILLDYKKAYSMNLTTFFLPNFFFYVFLYRYSPIYFNSYFPTLFTQSIILGLMIVMVSIGLSLIIKKIIKPKTNSRFKEIIRIESEYKYKCPFCATEFNSKPKYCYNCNNQIGEISDERQQE